MQDVDLERTSIKNIIEGRGKHPFEDLSREIIGAAVKVHKALGPGFLENIYEEALKIEFTGMGFHHDSQKEIKIIYKNWTLIKFFEINPRSKKDRKLRIYFYFSCFRALFILSIFHKNPLSFSCFRTFVLS